MCTNLRLPNMYLSGTVLAGCAELVVVAGVVGEGGEALLHLGLVSVHLPPDPPR